MVSSVYIAKNVYGGDGIGRLGDGRVVFVGGAFAGENVKAEIFEEKSSYVKARLVEVIDPSPDRLDRTLIADQLPDGPVPGMVYAGLSYNGECAAKQQQLAEFFERRHIPIPEIISCSNQAILNYRNKVVYHFARQNGRWVVGYRREKSHEIVDVERDPLALPQINAKLPEIRRQIISLLTQGAYNVRKSVEKEGCVTIRYSPRSSVQWYIGKINEPFVMQEVTCGKVFEVPSDGFYQVNPEIGERLVKCVVDEFVKSPTEMIVDLYCGVCVFGLSCPCRHLIGIESGRNAVKFAQRNAAAQRHPDARFLCGEVSHMLKKANISSTATVIIDPPRGGMEKNVPATIVRANPQRIIYISCDPATMMRDLQAFIPRYQVGALYWFNMFPRTARFETVVVLERT